MSNRARFRLAHVLVPLAFVGLFVCVLAFTGGQRKQRNYLIDRAAWGSRQTSGGGRWFVLGPKRHPTSRVSFVALWTHVRVEDHQAFKAPFSPAGRVDDCKTTFETEGLRVTAYSCRGRAILVAVRNDLDQPRLVLVEGA